MMNKKASAFGAFTLIVLFALLGYLIYLLYLNLPREPIEFKNVVQGNRQPEAAEHSISKQFYDSMRYQDKKINYHISDSCSADKKQNMLNAFSVLESKTILNFVPSGDDAQIKILCSDVAPEAGQEDYFVAGEGGPSKVINSTLYSIILEGKIALYRDEKCSETKIAIHELLHALGFDHNKNANSILYPTLNCNQQIDENVIEDINNLYSANPLSDFKIFKITASKGGRYLNFDIQVINQGIIDGQDVKMTIYQENEKVQDFDLGKIDVGSRKILTVENLKLPSISSNKISFVVDDENKIQELFEDNNREDLILRAG